MREQDSSHTPPSTEQLLEDIDYLVGRREPEGLKPLGSTAVKGFTRHGGASGAGRSESSDDRWIARPSESAPIEDNPER